MSLDIKESDWKIFRQVHETALDRFCQKVLSEVTHLTADTGKSNHERYGELYGLIKKRDKEMAHMFDRLSRSNALFQLASMRLHGLVMDDELARFSQEVRNSVQTYAEIARS